MILTRAQRSVIERAINAFETSSADGVYDKLVVMADGPHKMRQITYGRSQTTEFGNLRELVAGYVAANGQFSAALAPFADRVGSVPLADDATFKDLLRKAGRSDPKMKVVQDRFFEKRYFQPAKKWAEAEGLKQPLSMLVVYDSFIHSGGILWFLRQRFPESTPTGGGTERAWIRAYVNARHQWLSTHPDQLLRNSSYRTRDLQREVAAGNWKLAKLPLMAHDIAVMPA